MSVLIKPTVSNIINLWFSVDTPIRQYKIKLNPDLWGACENTNRHFAPPSKKRQVEQYRKSDKVAFAKAVQQELERHKSTINTRVSKLN
ncbi:MULTISPECIES: hypothetical protein [Spirosoma]|uniref:Arm DNA-binding domain-containing protein n=1 Tax=Spirosoma liriopis TaxID=2937440 RepID=A0ABT0HRZ6_9BACT|nr:MULTISPECIES: hypothetical protein [Spirosoma]MCK8494953.1 hypothetical protein [Spirosoma liriopis]UHG94145.1 hypothetical protein LQ777_25755 [Spirosoma oryzicola]